MALPTALQVLPVRFAEGADTSEAVQLEGAALVRLITSPRASGGYLQLLHGTSEQGYFGPSRDIYGDPLAAFFEPGDTIELPGRAIDACLFARFRVTDAEGAPVAQPDPVAFTLVALRS